MSLKFSYRILCILVAFVLLSVAVLHPFSVSALVVEAGALGGATIAIEEAIAAVLIALGIGVGSSSTDFDMLVDALARKAKAQFPQWIDGTGALKIIYENRPGLSLLPKPDPEPDSGGFPVLLFLPMLFVAYILANVQTPSESGEVAVDIWNVSFPGNRYWYDLVSYLEAYDQATYTVLKTFLHAVFFKAVDDQVYFLFSNYPINLSNTDSGLDVSCSGSCLLIRMVNGITPDPYLLSSWSNSFELKEHTLPETEVFTDLDLDIDTDNIGSTLDSDIYGDWVDSGETFVFDEDEDYYLPFYFPEDEGLLPDLTPEDIQEPAGCNPDVLLNLLDFVEVKRPDPYESDIPGSSSGTNYSGVLDSIIAELVNLGIAVSDFFASFWNKLGNLFSSIESWIINLGQSIISGIQFVLEEIFVPGEDFVSSKVSVLASEYSFVSSIVETVSSIGGAFGSSVSEPPVIYADLSAAESDYDYGDRAVVLDLRWYSRYKPTVDTLISAFLWVVFTWRVFIKLPNIINGVAGDFEKIDHKDTAKIRKNKR